MIADLPTADTSHAIGMLRVARAAAHQGKAFTDRPVRLVVADETVSNDVEFARILASLRRQNEAEASLARWIDSMTEDQA